MKAHNPIDDMFQQHFAETAVPMNNQEELWQRISDKKDDKNRGFLWLSSLGLIFCVVAGFGLMNLNNSTDQNISNNTLLNSGPNTIEKNQLILSTSEEHDDPAQEETKEDVTLNEIDLRKLKIPTVNNAKKSLIKNSKEKVSNAVVDVTKRSVMSSSTGNLNKTGSEKLIKNQKENTLLADKAKTLNFAMANLEMENVSLSDNVPPVYNQSDSWSRCEVKTPGHFFVDAYGQGGLPLDKVDFAQAGSDQTVYRDLWETRFDPKASWHGGLQVGYEFRNGLRVSAGAEYQELVTEYADNQRITETIRVWDPQAFFTIDMNGDRVWVGDTVTAINIYDRKFVRKNVHTMLHIPLQVSYDIYKRPGFHVAVDVAAALNVSKTYEGQFIRSDQTLIMIDGNNQDNYTSKDIGVSLAVGLHLGKYLNDNWEVYVSPRFRYNPNSYLLDTETLKITRNMIGLRGGVRYHF